MLALVAALRFLAAASPCLLPAYAHNDYENERPLEQAIELGYRGVEADFFLVDGELLIAHDRRDVQSGRTLESLYLAPLEELIERRGSVHGDGEPFFLNIEAKEAGRDGYLALRQVLERYADILAVFEGGRLRPGPIWITLVGWYPREEYLLAEQRRFVGIHRYLHELSSEDLTPPNDLLRMVSVEYRRMFRWAGRGRPPRHFLRGLEEIEELKREHPELVVRILRAPRASPVYAKFLEAGVDLIAAKNLEKTQRLLRPLVEGCE